MRILIGKGLSLAMLALTATGAAAQSDEVTFHKDIEPILQRSCQNCHRVGGAGPSHAAGHLRTGRTVRGTG